MKLNFNQKLIRDIREAPKFMVPKNIFLLLLVCIAVFFGVTMVESMAMMVWLVPKTISWMMENMSADGVVDSEQLNVYMTDLLLDPTATIVMLYCTAAATLAVFIYCRFVEGRKLHTLGFYKEGALKQYAVGLAVGFVMFSAVVGLNLLFGGIRFEGLQHFSVTGVLLVLGGFLLQGMSEEVICRGFMLTSALRNHRIWIAVLINSVIFGAAHLGNDGFNLFAMVNIVLFGVFMSLYMLRTGSIWGACAVHSIWNFVQGNFYGMPVSGIDSGDTIFRCSLTEGNAFVNGGAFGAEAGIATTIVLVLAAAALFLIPVRTGEDAV